MRTFTVVMFIAAFVCISIFIDGVIIAGAIYICGMLRDTTINRFIKTTRE